MPAEIQYIHLETNLKLEDYIATRVARFYKYYHRIEGIKVVLKFNKEVKKENNEVEITLEIPGDRLSARKCAENFENAFELSSQDIILKLLNHKIETLETCKSIQNI